MKELDSFTVERLEEITELKALSFPPSHAESAALARIALAAKRAEPVAWVVGDEEIADFKNGREVCVMRDCDDEKLDYLPLYTTPQLNSPQGWINCSDHRPARGADVQVYCSDTREQFVAFHIGNGEFQYAQNEDTSIACRPSHWMPLPAAPEKPL
ncbi:DUF551 domain-containing protein [Yersinia aleksiciae]|uniref:DUF551 domain-containing protein n=1 Tax=Yersinia aleksiciae TaxID=263819 RepID=UPI0005DC26EA|nr:DUF551 domain-containing protein [Yersinia aleksiciae]CFQ47654.1 Protein of uncharacterised function (DUF551) [Yersinia aleksiciae]